jgi:hypothetical protein
MGKYWGPLPDCPFGEVMVYHRELLQGDDSDERSD